MSKAILTLDKRQRVLTILTKFDVRQTNKLQMLFKIHRNTQVSCRQFLHDYGLLIGEYEKFWEGREGSSTYDALVSNTCSKVHYLELLLTHFKLREKIR